MTRNNIEVKEINIYGLSEGAQHDLVDKLCFNKCGKISIGIINFCGGNFWPCYEDECQFEDKRLNTEGRIETGENLFIRKLRSETKEG